MEAVEAPEAPVVGFSCVISGGAARGMRVFASSMQCIGKLGKEMFIEALQDRVSGASTAARGRLGAVRSSPLPSDTPPALALALRAGPLRVCPVQLTLRTLNDARSAFAAFSFHKGELVFVC